jgi:superfamily I DNA/RNA helicase
MQFHKLDRTKDKNFWSVRVSRDIRLIVHRTQASLLLCYVDHHDEAYRWAERRKIERHPRTGAAQLVEVRETVQEITVPRYVEAEALPKPLLFDKESEEQLLGYGVPEEWLDDVKKADEDSLFEIVDHLPKEAAEALLNLAVGVAPEPAAVAAAEADPFEHPDAKRRFRVMESSEELASALDYPWEKWAVFLHPSQRDIATESFNGPARVAGSAGTGKTVVAIHRAAHLAREHRDARLLLTTFSQPLARALRTKLRYLIGNQPLTFERIDVESVAEVAGRLYAARFEPPRYVEKRTLKDLIASAADDSEELRKFSEHFLLTEWNDVVDAWQLTSWEAYRDIRRIGRKTRLPEQKRQALWHVYESVREELQAQSLLTVPMMFDRITEALEVEQKGPYDFIVVDEAQDMGVPELRFLAALKGSRPDSLFFAGDLGQRIFQPPFSWKALGVDVRGRSRTLRINYRTSHQIRSHADKLLPPELSDVDGNTEERRGTISAFDGPSPVVAVYDSVEEEQEAAAKWLKSRIADGIAPEAIAVFVRSSAEIMRAEQAAQAAGLSSTVLDETLEPRRGHVSLMTMHLAKGLEFRAVLVMACDDEILPLNDRIASVGDDADLEEVYNTERHLLYVACTRARDHLMITGVDPASEFLDDLQSSASSVNERVAE